MLITLLLIIIYLSVMVLSECCANWGHYTGKSRNKYCILNRTVQKLWRLEADQLAIFKNVEELNCFTGAPLS